MDEKLVVVVLGNRESGKTTTWNTLFGRTVKTGSQIRSLELPPASWCDVFLVSGSAEERNLYMAEIVRGLAPRIVLCSMQYHEDVADSIRYFRDKEFAFYVMWLNPGYSDIGEQPDRLALVPDLLSNGATFCIRDGRRPPEARVQEIRDFVHGWASSRGLLHDK